MPDAIRRPAAAVVRPPAWIVGPARNDGFGAGAPLQQRGATAMKAVEITSYGAPQGLRLGERPDPVAGPGEVLVRVAASGVNRPDALQRTGNYPVPPGASDIPGLEIAGAPAGGDAPAAGPRAAQ